MTLEDFFTLTEMKDGFTAPVRVEELITVMQKEKDSLAKSVGEATRQWAAVASTIAATKNKECLDLFIQLDGLLFIDRWLKDAQTFPDEPSDCFVEEAISALLLAIEKLQLDTDKLTSSGICITVKSLLDYKSIRVQDKARALCDSWKAKDVDFESIDAEQAPVNNDPKLDNQDPESQLPVNDASPKKSLVDQNSEGAELGESQLTGVEDSSQIPSNLTDSYCNNVGPNMVTSPAKVESIGGDPPRELCASGGNLNSGYVDAAMEDAAAMQDTDGDTDGMTCEGFNPGSVDEDVKHETNFEMLRDKSGNIILISASDVPDSNDVLSSTDAKPAEGALDKPDAGDYHKDESPMKITSGVDSNSFVGQSTNEMVDKEQNNLEQGDAFAVEESKDQRTTMPPLDDDDDDEYNELKSYCKSERRYLGKSCDFASLTKPGKTADILRETRDVDLEDGTVDALEVARLVANEVEREVGGYCEQSDSSTSSSSSSDRMSRGGITQQDIQSINGEQEMKVNSPGNAPDASIKDPLMTLANVETKPKNSEDGDSSSVTDAVQDPQRNGEKSSWEFDLNQEFSSDDADHQVDTGSNPVSVVSASRAVVASEMRAGPLQFEGSLGWKGSAATSAFRPAPLRRASSDWALSGGATISGCQQRQNFLDFDLNVAESADDKVSNPVFDKQKHLLPSLTSHNSSGELSPKRSQRLTLDLNQVDDDVGFLAKEWKMGGQIFHPQNSHRSPSPASSSSCMQPSMRNFDLNDNLFNCNDSSNQPAFLGESSHKVNSSMVPEDDTFISILGTKVKRNACPPHAPSSTPNGKESEPLMDSSLLTRGSVMGLGPPAAPYPLGFNGLAMGSSVSLASAQIYRPGAPLPYVFDSRGAPFLPQMLGSATTVPPSYCQPSFVMNLMGTTPGPNLAGPFRPNLDLNSGFTNVVGAGTPDPGFYRPLFIPHDQVRPSEEQMSLSDSFRPLGVGTSGGKRKEPDSGWDFYPGTCKNQPPHL